MKISWAICTNFNLVAYFSTSMQVNQEVLKKSTSLTLHLPCPILNAQLPLSCIYLQHWASKQNLLLKTKPLPYSNAIDQMVPYCSLPFTCIWCTQSLSKIKCNSTRQTLIWCSAMSYLQSLLDNTCPELQHGRFSETCQIPNQLLPSCLKLLRDLVSSVASKTLFDHPMSKLTQDNLCNLLDN